MSEIDSEASSLEAWPSEPEGNGAAANGLADGNGKEQREGYVTARPRGGPSRRRRRRPASASGSTCSTASCSTT